MFNFSSPFFSLTANISDQIRQLGYQNDCGKQAEHSDRCSHNADSRPDFRKHQHHFPDHILLRYIRAVVGIVGIALGAVAFFVFGDNAVCHRCTACLISHNIADHVIALLMGDDKIVGLYGAAHAAGQHNGGGITKHGRSLHLKYLPCRQAI